MHDARRVLSELLAGLDPQGRDLDARVQAATLANRLALFLGDPSMADVAQAVAVDADRSADGLLLQTLDREAAVARATRRAVALSHRSGERSPSALAAALAADPSTLVAQVRALLTAGEERLAKATLEVARCRHPEDPELAALAQRLIGGPSQD